MFRKKIKMKSKIKISSHFVDIVAMSSGLSQNEINKALKNVKNLGLKPRLLGPVGKGLLAQDEKLCFKKFKQALFSTDSQIIWSLRGGYGSQRLLSYLDQIKKIPPLPKLFIGYSDVTVIHDFLHCRFLWPTLHFPVLSQLNFLSKISMQKFQSLLFNFKKYQTFSRLKILNKKWNGEKIISTITGGNLTMIQSSIGTPWSFSRNNQILFLEDNFNEKPHAIDRALWQMRQSGIFKNLKALIFGKFLNRRMSEDVLKPFAKKCFFPVIEGLPCGHNSVSHPLPLLTRAELILKKNQAELKVESPIRKNSWNSSCI